MISSNRLLRMIDINSFFIKSQNVFREIAPILSNYEDTRYTVYLNRLILGKSASVDGVYTKNY